MAQDNQYGFFRDVTVTGGRMDVIQHSHTNSLDVHLSRDISTSKDYILIDTSDTSYTNGVEALYIHLENILFDIDADLIADYEINVGYLKNVTTTGGTFVRLYSITGTKKAGNSKTVFIDPYPNGPKMINGWVITNDDTPSASYASTASVETTKGDTSNPSDGDIIVNIVMNAGSILLDINMSYHPHTD